MKLEDQKRLISVIVPVYNAEAYLEEMIKSIIEQTCQEWELILIDDGSTDHSPEICRRYAEKNEKILMRHIKHLNSGIARNYGLQLAAGKYVMFVDADDYLAESTVMQKMLDEAEAAENDITVCNYFRLWKGRLLEAAGHEHFSVYSSDSEEFRFRGFFTIGTLSYVWGKLYRREFLIENGLSFYDVIYAEDKLFNLQCYLCNPRYSFLDMRGYVYRKNEQSVSHQYKPNLGDCWIRIAYILDEMMRKTHQSELISVYRGLIQYILFFGIFFDAKMEYINHGKSIAAVRNLLAEYASDQLTRQTFRSLITEKRIHGLKQGIWIVVMRMFSLAMSLHWFWLLAIGIKLLIDFRIDERLSDTGLRE